MESTGGLEHILHHIREPDSHLLLPIRIHISSNFEPILAQVYFQPFPPIYLSYSEASAPLYQVTTGSPALQTKNSQHRTKWSNV